MEKNFSIGNLSRFERRDLYQLCKNAYLRNMSQLRHTPMVRRLVELYEQAQYVVENEKGKYSAAARERAQIKLDRMNAAYRKMANLPEPAADPDAVVTDPLIADAAPVAADDPRLPDPGPSTIETTPDTVPATAPGVTLEQGQLDDLNDGLRDLVNNRLNAALDGFKAEMSGVTKTTAMSVEDMVKKVNREVRDHLRNLQIPQKVTLERWDGVTVDVGVQHHRFADLVSTIKAGFNVLLVGPAGSGKTEAVASLAKAMELDFAPISLGPQTTQASIFGYSDATGNYVSTEFRRTYETGGMILLDEWDRCNERVNVTLNSAIGNGRCLFPDRVVDKHPDTIIVAAGNTTGHGADRLYISARQQDAATLNRFAVIYWGYDEGFETALAKGIFEACDAWLTLVRAVRKLVADHNMRYVVSPRASIMGAQGMRAGLDTDLLKETVLYAGWADEDRKKIEREVQV